MPRQSYDPAQQISSYPWVGAKGRPGWGDCPNKHVAALADYSGTPSVDSQPQRVNQTGILAAAESWGSRPSTPSAATVIALRSNDLPATSLRTVEDSADGMRTNSPPSTVSTVRAKPLIVHRWTAADGADAKIPHLSGGLGLF